jgi:hypothetical protein
VTRSRCGAGASGLSGVRNERSVVMVLKLA